MPIYRITVQQVTPKGDLIEGSLCEIIEVERESWSDIFHFVDEYRAEGREKEVVYLYNGALLEDDGECALPIPRLFHSVAEAQVWADSMEHDIRVVAGQRKGDTIVPKQ